MELWHHFAISLSLTTLVITSYPLLSKSPKSFSTTAKKAVMWAFFISLIPMTCLMVGLINNGSDTWTWMNIGPLNITVTFLADQYSIIFVPIALFVTWSILEFSLWYMSSDPKVETFFKFLLIFLVAMIILVTAGSMLNLFIGWEGVGLMSFLLIGWYHARSQAAGAAMQAIMYNRIGDIGFLLAFCWLMKNASSTDLALILSMKPSTPLLLAFITAAASKSAQFTLHPWLASAMEGPTPVSALLHSSTMVVAGVFLLIRIHPLLQQDKLALLICLCLGTTTSTLAAMTAIKQTDIKKIIAYSTSSQLGLMMTAIGINLPHLAFLHMCTHAFFKALLFLCSGIIIHNFKDEQDIRKMGGLQHILPFTSSCILIASMALMGLPFLAGFFSKDAIIEAMLSSYINFSAITITLLATSFTAAYSMRLIFFSSLFHPQSTTTMLSSENNSLIMNPFTRLALGSIMAGPLISQLVFPTSPVSLTIPTFIKLAALISTILGLILAYDLTMSPWSIQLTMIKGNHLFQESWYEYMIHPLLKTGTLLTSLFVVSHLIEYIILHLFGPEFLKRFNLAMMYSTRLTHTGMIKLYLTTLFIFLAITLSLPLSL
uniref:NADH-ubiquinone oxidoreductase chain 5 n=1 Tax=Cornufer vitiensis TaxID=58512 RepID=A0A0K0LG10_9NEOB|nr:NADH dehydrogenase subunit 5 [Cornufer vitiensis]